MGGREEARLAEGGIKMGGGGGREKVSRSARGRQVAGGSGSSTETASFFFCSINLKRGETESERFHGDFFREPFSNWSKSVAER